MRTISSVKMSKYFVVLEISSTPARVRIVNFVKQGTSYNDNTDDIDSWSKNSQTIDTVRDVEKFIAQNAAVMNDKWIDNWTPSTSVGDYTGYTAEMLETLLGIYYSHFTHMNYPGITDDYHLDISDSSNEPIDIQTSPNANAIKDLFVAAGKVFSVKSN